MTYTTLQGLIIWFLDPLTIFKLVDFFFILYLDKIIE
nr:MAG TPA: hypothetical protein [Caudoviricetes sp.]